MGSAPSSQRGGKATQSETTNANTAQVANMTIITSNPEVAHNARGAALISPATIDPKNGDATPSKNAATLVSCADATNFAAKLPEHAIGTPLGSALSTPNLPPEAVSPPQMVATPEVVTAPYDQNRARALDRNILSATRQTDTRNSKAGKRPRNRSRRGKGRGNDTPAPEETENIPPPSAREDKPSHQRRAHRRPGRARQAAKQGRSENGATDSERMAVTRLASEGISGGNEPTSRSAKPGGTRGTERRSSAGFRLNGKAPGHHFPSRARAGANVPGSLTISAPVRDVASRASEAGKTNHLRIYDEDQVVPVPIVASTAGTPVAPNESPVPAAVADVSIVPPLPSSTRRRTKEYFQRRTRERSVDAETGPPRRGAKAAEQVRRTNGEEARAHIEAGIKKRWSVPGTDKNDDQFAFDPEASPFTPNATSSPRQVSLSSFGAQSFSSPTPLPPHGNRNVEPLTLVRTCGKNNSLEATGSSSQRPIPLTPHGAQTQGGQPGDTYTYYAERNFAQAHLQAEQLELMRLQAYYSWLAETATGHMDLSGGSGGLSGGVALGLGRQGGRGRGKAQSRNSSGAYAHPKEHVVYSPREHEPAQSRLASRTDLCTDGAFGGPEIIMKTKEDEPGEMPDAAAQRVIQKWDGNWGLREAPTNGSDVGWRWGANSVGAVGSTGS